MAFNDTYEIGEGERKRPKPIDASALGLKPVMKIKDWIMIVTLIIVAGGLWTWVWREYNKPIIAENLPFDVITEETS